MLLLKDIHDNNVWSALLNREVRTINHQLLKFLYTFNGTYLYIRFRTCRIIFQSHVCKQFLQRL